MNQNKFRQIQSTLEQTEERADEAENVLMRAKSKIRNNLSSRLSNNNGLEQSKTISAFKDEKNLMNIIKTYSNNLLPKSYSTKKVLSKNKTNYNRRIENDD